MQLELVKSERLAHASYFLSTEERLWRSTLDVIVRSTPI